jgi:hypothetical protein
LCTEIFTETEFKIEFRKITGVEFPICIHAKAIEQILENGMHTEQMNERDDKFLNFPMDKVNHLYEKIRDSELIDEERIAFAQLIKEKMNNSCNIGKTFIHKFLSYIKISNYVSFNLNIIIIIFTINIIVLL